ncbi:MAG: acyl-ACP--UDP-N-acetylglucosamine O-acyltransferase [Armatimonadota bacterium]|nr:acyl-ACP--UDP-N-acetylglucosamine O-acyltransferase [Armatimonadota bacterium]
MTTVHPTAIIDPTAVLEEGVVVEPYAIIGPHVVIGSGTVVGPRAVIEAGTIIGRGNQISAGVVIGCPPQDRHFRGEESRVVIGDGNIIREYATISRATGTGTETVIGNENYIMSYVRIDHNCRIGNHVVLVSGVQLGGYVQVDDHAYVGGLSGIHQFVRVGRLSMIAACSMVRQDIPPYMLADGHPARIRALNHVGLRRAGIPAESRRALKRAFRLLYQSQLTLSQAIEKIEQELGEDAAVGNLLEFLRASRRGAPMTRGVARWEPPT